MCLSSVKKKKKKKKRFWFPWSLKIAQTTTGNQNLDGLTKKNITNSDFDKGNAY